MSLDGIQKKSVPIEKLPEDGEERRTALIYSLRAAITLALAPLIPKTAQARKKTPEAQRQVELPPGYLESSLTDEMIRGFRETARKRLLDNSAETITRIQRIDKQQQFENLQRKRMADFEKVDGIYRPSKYEILALLPGAQDALATLLPKIPVGETGVLINAGKNQRMYVIRNTERGAEFVFGARVTTGEDGISENPGDSNASRAGLQSIGDIVKDQVISGQNTAYNAATKPEGHQTFTILSRTGKPKDIFIAEPGVANVGLIAYRLFDVKGLNKEGQAMHAGPLKKGAASHGCTRMDELTTLTLDSFVKRGTPVFIYEGPDTRVPVARVEKPAQATQIQRLHTAPTQKEVPVSTREQRSPSAPRAVKPSGGQPAWAKDLFKN